MPAITFINTVMVEYFRGNFPGEFGAELTFTKTFEPGEIMACASVETFCDDEKGDFSKIIVNNGRFCIISPDDFEIIQIEKGKNLPIFPELAE